MDSWAHGHAPEGSGLDLAWVSAWSMPMDSWAHAHGHTPEGFGLDLAWVWPGSGLDLRLEWS